ncbi:hypothetical protein JCM3770_000245 [Rhodotorula araucariae]
MYRDQLLDDLYHDDLDMPASSPAERQELRERIASDPLALVNMVWFGNTVGACTNPACGTPAARSWHRGSDGKTLCKMCFGVRRQLGVDWVPSLEREPLVGLHGPQAQAQASPSTDAAPPRYSQLPQVRGSTPVARSFAADSVGEPPIFAVYRFESAHTSLEPDVVRDVVNRLRKLVAAVLVDKGLVEKEDDALRLVQPVISTGSGLRALHEWTMPDWLPAAFAVDCLLEAIERHSVKTVVVIGSSIPNIIPMRQLANAVGDGGSIIRIKSSVPTAIDHEVLSGPALVSALDIIVEEFEGMAGLAQGARLDDIARLTLTGAAATAKLEAMGTPEAITASSSLTAFIWRKTESWFHIALHQANELDC